MPKMHLSNVFLVGISRSKSGYGFDLSGHTDPSPISLPSTKILFVESMDFKSFRGNF